MKRTITSLSVVLSAFTHIANAGICTSKYAAERTSVLQQLSNSRASGQLWEALELIRATADSYDSLSAVEGISASAAKECSDYAVNYRLLEFQLYRELSKVRNHN